MWRCIFGGVSQPLQPQCMRSWLMTNGVSWRPLPHTLWGVLFFVNIWMIFCFLNLNYNLLKQKKKKSLTMWGKSIYFYGFFRFTKRTMAQGERAQSTQTLTSNWPDFFSLCATEPLFYFKFPQCHLGWCEEYVVSQRAPKSDWPQLLTMPQSLHAHTCTFICSLAAYLWPGQTQRVCLLATWYAFLSRTWLFVWARQCNLYNLYHHYKWFLA